MDRVTRRHLARTAWAFNVLLLSIVFVFATIHGVDATNNSKHRGGDYHETAVGPSLTDTASPTHDHDDVAHCYVGNSCTVFLPGSSSIQRTVTVLRLWSTLADGPPVSSDPEIPYKPPKRAA